MKSFFMYEYPSNFCLNLISKPAGEPVFLVFSKHITAWYNDDHSEDEATYVEVTYPRWKFLPQSSINYIMAGKILALTESEKKIKRLALEGTEPDPMDPNAPPKILEQQKKARDGPSPKVFKSKPPGPSSSQAKRKSGNTPKGNPTPKRGRIDSAATTPKVDKAEIIELRRALRESEDMLQTARDRVKRLEDREDAMKNREE